MNDIALKHLVEIYLKAKKELEDMCGDFERTSVDKEVFSKLKSLLAKKVDEAKLQPEKDFWSTLISGYFGEEADVVDKSWKKFSRQIPYDEKLKISYLESKLEAIKQVLGEDNLHKIVRTEIDNLFEKK
jgi:hypothetical protein